ncbi:MAG: EamA family transporter RarD [Marivibrio sp.]|uniref:EamA family transporter RarD n=1 Tax=Marivibrio sp. TaxID=2039719 RepID=UPI0032EE79EC
MSDPSPAAPERDRAAGYAFALAAFGTWALFPLFWNQIDGVPAIEMLAHRVLWTLPVCAAALVLSGRMTEIRRAFDSLRTIAFLALSTTLISINWGTYIYAVTEGHVLDASMGYFLNPLVNVLAGLLLFGERLRPLQWTAIALAAAGVAGAAIAAGQISWIGLTVAFSFGGYGAVRKLIDVPAIPGLLVETLLLAPLTAGYVIWLTIEGTGAFLTSGLKIDLLLLASGAVTALPLMWYVGGARRLPMSTMGMMFYLTPTGLFLLATLLYGEPVTLGDVISFGFIWAGLAVFTVDIRRNARRKNRATAI